MPRNAKTTDPVLAELSAIRKELAELNARLPLTVGSLRELAALQESICRTARKHVDPMDSSLRDLADQLGDRVGAEMAERIVASILVRLEPLMPVLLQLAGAHLQPGSSPADAA